MREYDWFKHGDHIRRRRARIPHVCSFCGRKIKIKELYVTITGINKGNLPAVKVCLDCFYPTDWVDDLEKELRKADRFERYD